MALSDMFCLLGCPDNRYFRRSKLLYTDYYWKTTHRMTTRFIMQCERGHGPANCLLVGC